MESNADVNAVDYEGNTPLHTKCAGEHNQTIDLNGIRILHEYGADVDGLNSNGETCFQLAAKNGHVDVLELLFELDEKKVRESNQLAQQKSSPSTLALALQYDHLDVASW